MQEIVDPQMVERALLLLAVGGLPAGLLVGAILGACKKRVRLGIIAGAAIGSVGVLIYGAWRLFNVITDALGLDSVANLLLQLVLFAILGVILGVAAAKLLGVLKRPETKNSPVEKVP